MSTDLRTAGLASDATILELTEGDPAKAFEAVADTKLLQVPPDISLLVIARALAQFGMTLKATHDGGMRVEPAELERGEIMRLNVRNSRDPMHFTPATGYCWNCGADVVAQHGAAAIAAGMNVTGCRKCHKSYCD